MGRTGAHPLQGLSQQGEDAEHGKSFQGQQNPAAGAVPDLSQDRQVPLQCFLIHHEAGRWDPVQIKP